MRYLYPSIIFLTMVIFFSSCMSYSTLQSAKTIKPGEVLIGAGSAFPVTGNTTGIMPEVSSRIGIVNNFDIGAKYSLPSLFFLDGKIQLINEQVTLSADLGWSYFNYSSNNGKSKGKSTGWYPMLILGQEHWYVGIKEVYFSTKGEFEFFGINKFEGSGWITTNIFAGGVIGKQFRLLPEVNFIIPRDGKTLIVPALGLQFVL